MPERLCELFIPHRMRRYYIYRPLHGRIVDRQLGRADGVFERHPADVLPSRSDLAPHALFERRQKLREHTSFARQDGPETKIDYAHAGFGRRLARLLPFTTNAREKSASRLTLFVKHLVIAVAIDSGG